jgi:signal transduction histidine kinase
MNIAASLHFVAVAVTFTLGGFVIRTNPRRTTNQIYLLFSFQSGLWLICLACAFLSKDMEIAAKWIHASHSVGALIPMMAEWLRLAILNPNTSIIKIAKKDPILLGSTLFLSFLSQTSFIIKGAYIPDIPHASALIPEIVFGKLYPLYAAYFTIVLGILGYRFWQSRRQATGMQRAELDFAGFGAVLSLSSALAVSILTPLLTGNSQSAFLSSLSVMILNITIAYGIATRRIMDMAHLFRLVIAYSLLAAYLALLYLAVWSSVSFLLRLQGLSPIIPAGLLASIAVAFSLAPAHGFMQRFADRIFAQTSSVNMQSVMQLTNRLLYSISTVESLLVDFSAMICQILGTDKVCILLAENGEFSQKYPLPSSSSTPLILPRNSALPQIMISSDDVIVPSILRRLNPKPALAAACKTIDDLTFSAAIGLHSKEGLEGIVLLGPKLNGLIYGSPEQHAIQLLCNHLAMAINNARLYTQVQDSKSYNDILVDSLISGVIAAGHDGKITVFNREAQRITGLPSSAALGHPLDCLPIPLKKILGHTLEHGIEIVNQDNTLALGKEDPTPLRLSSAVIYGHTGNRLGAFLVMNDLTTIRHLELQIRRTDHLASLGTLAAGMAHEIKNPLVSIKAFTQLLPERYDDSDFRETFSSLVGGEVKRIDTIVNQLLRFSRPSKPMLAPLDLNATLNSSLNLLQQQLRTNNIRLVTNLAASPDLINGDGNQLSQALINFLLNSIESMPKGGTLTVTTSCPPPQPNSWWNGHQGGPVIMVTIEDTGEGIPESALSHIFDPFFTTKAQGTGLGLSVAHGIINEHRGLIDVKSEEGKGTIFTLVFPLLGQEEPS